MHACVVCLIKVRWPSRNLCVFMYKEDAYYSTYIYIGVHTQGSPQVTGLQIIKGGCNNKQKRVGKAAGRLIIAGNPFPTRGARRAYLSVMTYRRPAMLLAGRAPGRARARSIGWILGFLAVVLGPRFVGIPRRRPSFRPAGGPPAGDADPLTRTSAAAAPLHRHQSTPAGRPAAREGDASHATTAVPLELQCARQGRAGRH